MSRIIVKICGVTTPDDARLCRDAGADHVGVILAPSPRRVDLIRAAAIRAAVPDVRLVGVFTEFAAGPIVEAVRTARIDLVQLHGCDDPRRWAEVAAACGRPVIPAVTADRAPLAFEALKAHRSLAVPYLLLDLPKNPSATVTARREELWLTARQLSDAGAPVLLAGSLAAEDVAAARHHVRPTGLDTCRGTECAPGVKDPDRVRRFLAAARTDEVRHAS